MSTFSDEALIARVVAHDDRNAFAELVRRYQSQVRSLQRKLTAGDAHLADDLAQETFIRVYRHLRTFQGGAKFSTWLYRIAYNVFLSSARQAQNRRSEEYVDEVHAQAEQPHEERLLARVDLARAMADCSEAERAALALCYGKGMTHEQAAEVLRCPLGTVKTNVLRGKEKLKQRLLSMEGVMA